ncbi:histidine phosphatase superfamily-domain-containing protein [Tribonema minus]|uniref:Inositol hexakisphosphate and diphosphoinositol-pentakisphosphate kinase n=1 Tax=Tribonema minus TaxID=303371 RepID=A0A835YTL2_9STRA|nr:histidine phosphatase superfamily-domain-containing protein [Tribonema minus]
MRHGDRTPKQKMKMHVTCSHYLNYFARHAANPRKDLKVKGKMELKEFLKVTVDLLEGGSLYSAEGDPVFDQDVMTKYLQIRHVLERWEISGINRKLQLKPHAWVTPEGATTERATELELILKWGGELTKLGERQAMELGDNFRRAIYPDVGGGGLLRLHSTFRHDLKIKTSDEGRVMKTAAAFAKGFLELEGGLTPILVSLVHKEKSSGMMLDQTGNKDIKKDMDRCKAFIKKVLDTDVDMSEEAIRAVVPASQESVMGALRKLRNPQARLREVMGLMEGIVKQLEDRVAQCGASPMARDGRVSREERDYDRGQAEMKFSTRRPARGETLLLMVDRWRTLRRELYNERKGGFDITKVPDVHDNARYDCLHNWSLKLEGLDKLYDLAKDLADCVVPQEYGITVPEKQTIGSKMCNALLEKIRMDLIIARGTNEDDSDMRYNLDLSHAEDLPINSLGRRVRTRLYFTSESHLQTLLNVLRYPIGNRSSVVTEEAARMISRTKELCYLTSFVLRLFEDLEKPPTDPTRFRVEILFSPGVVKHPLLPDDHLHTAPLVPLHKNLSCAHLEGSLEAAMTLAATPHVDEAAHEREEELLRAQWQDGGACLFAFESLCGEGALLHECTLK